MTTNLTKYTLNKKTIRRIGAKARSGVVKVALSVVIGLSAPQTGYGQQSGSSDLSTDDPFKVFTVFASGSVTSDSNLFRRPDALAQSDTFMTGRMGLRFDKPFGQQHFKLEVAKTATSYEKFKYLDFDAINYSGAWNWHLGPRISGKLSAARSESLAPFEDTLGAQRNVRISQNQAFDLDAWVSGGWHLLLGASQNDQKSEQSTLINRAPDFRSNTGSGGVKYLSRAGNSVTARWQTTEGTYINNPIATLNSDYTENLGEFSADWKMNGSSSFNLRLGWLERLNADPARSNFSGPSSSLNYAWAPGGKLGLTLSASRKTSPVQSLGVSHKEDNSFSVTPTWRTSEKTNAFFTLAYQKSQDQGSGGPIIAPLRQDVTNTATIGLSWTAARALSVSASVQRIQRTSNTILADFETSVANISASLTF